ncbi:ester cyclase [Nocardia sp. NPDC059180]|uniref:ester cyclase n=1 Tax=Nocardia sp. NPDC059180 TaxID=3346761 RepID=UPI0036CB015D
MPEPAPADIVRAYASAKSRADVPAALTACHRDAVFETIPFQALARGTDEAARHFTGFFRAFPDYHVELEYLHSADDLVVGSGIISATMRGPLAGIEPTGTSYRLPFACHWTVSGGLIIHERFFFDFHQMCEQLGFSTDYAAAQFRIWREKAEASQGRHDGQPGVDHSTSPLVTGGIVE